MINNSLTGMEFGVLSAYYDKYADNGFPAPDLIKLLSRENTGAGRYTELCCENKIDAADGYLYLSDCFIEVDGLDHGLSFFVCIEDNKLKTLEFAVNGVQDWDGHEDGWELVC